MIEAIANVLEDLGFGPAENTAESVSYQVIYGGMEPAETWRPEVFEMYEVRLWIDEEETSTATQTAIQDATRAAFTAVSKVLNANAESVFVVSENLDSSEEPTVTMIFRTVEQAGDWI